MAQLRLHEYPHLVVLECIGFPLYNNFINPVKVTYKPWLNSEDPDKCLFVSVHGYGLKEREMPSGWFYPGSGETTDCPIPDAKPGDGGGGGGGAAAATEREGGDADGGDKAATVGGGGPGVIQAADREVRWGAGGGYTLREIFWR